MRLFPRETDRSEKLFRVFISDLMAEGFDLMIFSEHQIKNNLGKGLYGAWQKSLGPLGYKKIILIFNDREPKVSWPSDGYPDRLVVNMAHFPDQDAILNAEQELLDLLAAEQKVS